MVISVISVISDITLDIGQGDITISISQQGAHDVSDPLIRYNTSIASRFSLCLNSIRLFAIS